MANKIQYWGTGRRKTSGKRRRNNRKIQRRETTRSNILLQIKTSKSNNKLPRKRYKPSIKSRRTNRWTCR